MVIKTGMTEKQFRQIQGALRRLEAKVSEAASHPEWSSIRQRMADSQVGACRKHIFKMVECLMRNEQPPPFREKEFYNAETALNDTN